MPAPSSASGLFRVVIDFMERRCGAPYSIPVFLLPSIWTPLVAVSLLLCGLRGNPLSLRLYALSNMKFWWDSAIISSTPLVTWWRLGPEIWTDELAGISAPCCVKRAGYRLFGPPIELLVRLFKFLLNIPPVDCPNSTFSCIGFLFAADCVVAFSAFLWAWISPLKIDVSTLN